MDVKYKIHAYKIDIVQHSRSMGVLPVGKRRKVKEKRLSVPGAVSLRRHVCYTRCTMYLASVHVCVVLVYVSDGGMTQWLYYARDVPAIRGAFRGTPR